MIIYQGLGVLGIIIALNIPLSVTICPPPAQSSFWQEKRAGTQGGIWKDAANDPGKRVRWETV